MPTFEWKLVQPLWNTVWSFLKKLKIITIWPSNYFSGYLPEKFGANIRWMDKEDVVHIYNEILLGHKIRWNTAICNNVDGSWEYHAKRNKSGRTSQEPYNFTYMWDPKLKATNEQTRQTKTGRHRWQYGKWGGVEVVKGKQGQIYGDRRRLDFGWWTQQCSTQIVCNRVVHLTPM